MNSNASVNGISEQEKRLLVELISTLREKESMALLKEFSDRGCDPAELLSYCMEGVKRVGFGFEKGEYYISALIMAGEIMRQAAEFLSNFMVPVQTSSRAMGHILLGTIKGDIHDLGKNILKDMFTCNGFRVTDLGVDVPIETFVAQTRELDPDFVAISCLLTTCLDNLTEAVQKIREAKPDKKDLILVGGNSLDRIVNDVVKADAWFSDATLAVPFCKKVMAQREGQGQEK